MISSTIHGKLDLSSYLKLQADRINAALDEALPPADRRPSSVHEAIRYSIFAPGKRLRPILALAMYEACGGKEDKNILSAACGLELLHVYSLVHDDLPCMDNDDLRRGKPTAHKVFGEALAVLAGDAMNAMAFDFLAQTGDLDLVREVATAVGTSGMIGGQVEDMEAEGRDVTSGDVEFIHRHKTAALIRVSIWTGGQLAGADDATLERISEAGWKMGMAFQIIDDILDMTSTPEELGKACGADEILQKATYPKVWGLEVSREHAHEYIKNAKDALAKAGPEVGIIQDIADYVVTRIN